MFCCKKFLVKSLHFFFFGNGHMLVFIVLHITTISAEYKLYEGLYDDLFVSIIFIGLLTKL